MKCLQAIALLLCTWLAGCALPPGEGWQSIDLSVQATFESDGRILDNGRFKTSKNYEIEFSSVELQGLGFSLEALKAADGLQTFDPQNPPEGYSLCHNGHCHSASGELVDYEDIQAELNQASDAGGLKLFQELLTTIAFPDFSTSPSINLELGPCNDTYLVCDIGRDNQLTSILFETTGVALSFTVFHPEHLPAEGLTVSQELPLEMPISLTLNADSQVTALSLQLAFEKAIWDSTEFQDALATDASSPSWDEAQLINLLQTALLENLKLSQL